MFTVERVFAPGLRWRLHRPDLPDRLPVQISVSGGGWTAMGLSVLAQQTWLCRFGVAVACVEYRTAPTLRGEALVAGVAAGIAALRRDAATLDLDPRRIALCGDSAGAHLVTLLALRGDGGWRPQAVTATMGVYDLRADDLRLCRSECSAVLGGDPRTLSELAAALSPISHITSAAPPLVLAHGRSDRLVSVEQSRTFHRRLRDAGRDARLIEVPGAGHDGLALTSHPEVRAAQRDLLARVGFGCG